MVTQSPHGEQSRPLGSPLPDARCFLSLGERIKVRGIGANYHLAYWTIPVQLGELSGGTGEFLK
jgi:hypothetical protein